MLKALPNSPWQHFSHRQRLSLAIEQAEGGGLVDEMNIPCGRVKHSHQNSFNTLPFRLISSRLLGNIPSVLSEILDKIKKLRLTDDNWVPDKKTAEAWILVVLLSSRQVLN